MMNINSELQKIKEYLSSKINLPVEIVPNYDEGNKVIVKCMYNDNGKNKKAEYSFYINYYEDKDNYKNAPYLLHCDFWYGDGGSGYADKYDSLNDFKNTRQYKELLEKYGKNNIQKQQNKYESISLFDIDNDEEDNEVLNVLNDNQISIFDDEENNQPTIFNLDLEDNKTDVQIFDGHKYYLYLEDLMSYGIDDYYKKHLSSGSPLLSTIHEELSKLPKYDEYYKKLTEYLKVFLPVKDYETTGWNFTGKCMFINDDNIITVRANRQQCPVYCYEMYKEEFE